MRRQWLESFHRSKIRSVTFIFVPGHASVRANERADRLARFVTIDDGQPIDCADIKLMPAESLEVRRTLREVT